jgi:hypothetical protein
MDRILLGTHVASAEGGRLNVGWVIEANGDHMLGDWRKKETSRR